MAYNTPELLLVGAATNLVLGGVKDAPNYDDFNLLYGFDHSIDDSAW